MTVVAGGPCAERGCRGEATEGGQCLAHLERSALVDHVRCLRGPAGLNARGVEIDGELLETILAAFAEDGDDVDGRRQLDNVDFSGASFTEYARFDHYLFTGFTRFSGTRFDEGAAFYGSRFVHSPHFERAHFDGPADFKIRERGSVPRTATVFERRAFFTDAEFAAGATFDDASFGLAADFSNVCFGGLSSFDRAEFIGPASFPAIEAGPKQSASEWPALTFTDTHFAGELDLGRADLRSHVMFDGGRFDRFALFAGTRFGGSASFAAATFSGRVDFSDAVFEGPASFKRVALADEFTFSSARFVDAVLFDEAKLTGHPRPAFAGTRSDRLISFRGATIECARVFGPMLLLGRLALDHVVATEPLRIDAAGGLITAERGQFRGGLDLRLRWTTVLLEDADLSAASSIATAVPFLELDASALPEPVLQRDPRPRIVSLRRSDVSALRLDAVDLRPCRFAGALRLSSLRIDGTRSFEPAPTGWRWTDRQAIAEEHEWRATNAAGWYPEGCQPGLGNTGFTPDPPFAVQQPPALAGIYRSLRVGREALRDEPGAADSYYGEMEMRRRGADPRAERLLLTGYWLVSGYGLRGSRALAALAVTILVFSLLFWSFGFPERRSYVDVLVFTAADSTSLFRPPASSLNLVGTTLELGLRLLGPLFVGLALLSVRNRIKR